MFSKVWFFRLFGLQSHKWQLRFRVSRLQSSGWLAQRRKFTRSKGDALLHEAWKRAKASFRGVDFTTTSDSLGRGERSFGKPVRIQERQVCASIRTDIRNAFNTARWKICIETMVQNKVPDYLLQMIDDYLSDRWVIYEDDNWSLKEEMTCGAPQGSRVRFPALGLAYRNEHHRLRGWRTCRVYRWRRQNPGTKDQWKSVAGKALVG